METIQPVKNRAGSQMGWVLPARQMKWSDVCVIECKGLKG